MDPEQSQLRKANPELSSSGELSTTHLAHLTAAFGNSETKTIAYLAFMLSNHSAKTLENTIASLSDSLSEPPLVAKTLMSYCNRNFLQRGLLRKATYQRSADFELTEYGRKHLSYAGLLAQCSLRYPNTTLLQLNGPSQSDILTDESIVIEGETIELRRYAAEARMHIYRSLLSENVIDGKSIKAADLSEKTGLKDSIINNHLTNLGNHNIVEYKTIGPDQRTMYRFNPGAAFLKIRNENSIRRLLYNFSRYQSEAFSSTDMSSYLERCGVDVESVSESTIQQAIDHLLNNSVITINSYSVHQRSHISLTTQQHEMLADLVDIWDRYQKGDHEIRVAGLQAAHDILNDPEKVSLLLHKALDTSPNTHDNTISRHSTLLSIRRIIAQNPGISSAEFHTQFSKERPAGMSINTVRELLRDARDAGIIEAVPGHGIHGWKIKST